MFVWSLVYRSHVLKLVVHSILPCSRVRKDYGVGATSVENEEDVSFFSFDWSQIDDVSHLHIVGLAGLMSRLAVE
jgi:hypothetical protein